MPIPISARFGDNVTNAVDNTPWYRGPTLLDYLETIDVDGEVHRKAVPISGAMGQPAESRFPRLCRHGRVRHDQSRRPHRRRRHPGQTSRVKELVTYDGPLPSAQAGDAITITLADEIDIARGDVLVSPDVAPRGVGSIRRARDLDER